MTQIKRKTEISFLIHIRFLAVCLIVIFHIWSELPVLQEYVVLWGRIGVALFFGISGAGLIYNYSDHLDVKKFYLKRIRSIYIPFYITYALVYFIESYIYGFEPIFDAPIRNFIFTLLGIDGYLSTFGVPTFYLVGEWFLGVIVFIYLIFPLWRVVFNKFPVLSTIFVLGGRSCFIYHNFLTIPVCFNIFTALWYFNLGALFIKYVYRRIRLHYICVLPAIASIIFGLYLCYARNNLDYAATFAAAGIWVLLYAASDHIRVTGPVRWICGMSYEIFLTHHVMIYLMLPVIRQFQSWGKIIGGTCVIVLCILIAANTVKHMVNCYFNRFTALPH